jgi:hypothetical protein
MQNIRGCERDVRTKQTESRGEIKTRETGIDCKSK